jgi:hypothetical protein
MPTKQDPHCQEPAYANMTFSSLKIHANKLAGESLWGISDVVWRRRTTEGNKFGLSRSPLVSRFSKNYTTQSHHIWHKLST